MKNILILALVVSAALAWQSFAPGEGPFDHLSNEEFAAQYLMSIDDAPLGQPPKVNSEDFLAELNGLDHFDWRDHSKLGHCVRPIRDQGKCGSCWAHATSEFLSDRSCIQNKGATNLVFSPQYMVDCADASWEALGCQGAETQKILYWLEQYGLVNETCNPYTSGQTQVAGQCHNSTCPTGEYMVKYEVEKGSTKLFFNYTNVEMAKDLYLHGPFYFSMVVFSDFKAYKGGVYHPISYEVSGTHAVKCVGWGIEEMSATPYWICANSWTTGWGEEGFFRIGFNNFIGYKAGSARMKGQSTPIKSFLS
jgi:C1A family cysteine protease